MKNKIIKSLVFIISITTASCVHGPSVKPAPSNEAVREPSSLDDKIKIVDLSVKTTEPVRYIELDLQKDLASFENHVQSLLLQSNNEKNLEKKSDEKKSKPLTMQEAIKFDAIEKGYRAGLKNILEQINFMKNAKSEFEKKSAAYKIKLISQALQNKYITPIKTSFEATLVPIYILRYNYNVKIDKENAGVDSKVNPENSLLWTNQISKISTQNLFLYRYQQINDEVCEYEKAKSGWGVHAGFHINCGEKSFKLKFGNEIYSGPLNSRIYQLLGYHSPEINYVSVAKVRYSRRMFTEYNLRKITEYAVTLLGKKVGSYTPKTIFNLFDQVSEFVLKSGQHIKTEEFKKELLKNEVVGRDIVDSDFNEQVESEVSYVIFNSGTITEKTKNIEIGPWKLDDLDFTEKREFRALLVLSAWLGNFDVRMDNNRLLQLDKASDEAKLRLAIVDVGSGLGNSNSVVFKSGSTINEMPWSVTETYKDRVGDSEEKDRLQMYGYLTLELNKTFEKVQLADAQWMLRQMCQITPTQIRQALVASGLSSAGVKLAEAKLLNRRNKMIEDFEMQNELKAACFSPVNKKMNYNPKADGLLEVSLADATKATAPDKNEIVKDGQLVIN